MALDIYDSQYLLILAPSLVIALMFLFFWLFMKETSYDEVLARQKRDLKLPSAKPDSRKKNEKKKSKRKEVSGGGSGGGGGGGESEEDLRDFDMSDGLSPNVEAEEEPEPLVTLDPSPPAPSAEISASSEAPSGLRERKKKEKKAAKAAAAAAAAAAALAAASHLEESEINDSKPVNNKREPSPLASKQVSPTSLQMEMQVQVQAVQAPIQTQTPPQTSGKKRDRKKQKVESGHFIFPLPPSFPFYLALSEVEAVSVISLLREKSPNALDAWHKSTARPDPAAQEREKLLVTLQEESSIAKDKVKQLSQELQHEKQKTGRVEAMMREQRAAMEKELGGMQAKAQGSYQELQNMQIKFQQMREQMESQITRLQQENGILRDAVSSATTQMESKNSAELNKLRSEYAGLMKELGDTNSKLQQEEHQRKSLEVNYKQNVSQLEDAKRRWEELQNFLHNVNTEREKLQSSNQAIETEMNNKNKEMQTLHSSLTEAMVSKEQLERRVMELMEMSQRSMPDETLQAQVQVTLQVQNETQKAQNESLQAQISSQATHVSHIEELQKLLAEKELQRKSLEDALNAERSSGAGRETNMQVCFRETRSFVFLYQHVCKQTSSSMLAAKDQEIQVLQAELEGKTKDLSEKVEQIQQQVMKAFINNRGLLCSAKLSEKENQVRSLQSELTELRDSLELHRKKNNELREKNWSAMEALSATESMLQGKLSKAVKEGHAALAETQAECRDFLHRLLPHVPLPSEQNHQEWLQRFESAAAESLVGQSSQELAEKLKEAEESQRILQKDCETYKKVLAETEGILQRLQSSVEEEESRWKVKLEQSQEDVREVCVQITSQIRLLIPNKDNSLRREKQHLESELEKAERESATYVTEVRELKTQLTETLSKLEAEENERQRVAGDLYKAQQSLDLIQGELSKLTENTDDLIENSSLSSQREEIEKKEKMTAGLNQTVREMQQLLQTVSQQLAKGQQGVS
uniref:Kinectin 1 n=1 Tax=Cyprinodon variegatus TaxID=28743 RepID=A0A3Q2GQQ8_CYPVA